MKNLTITILCFIIASFAIAQDSLDSGLVAFYPFNGNANDETGNGYNGSVSGATLTMDRFNLSDKAYNFIYNGFSSDKIQVSGTSGLNFSTGGFSLSAWIKFSGTAGAGNNYPIVSKHTCGEQSGYILMLYNGKLTFWLAGSSGYNVLSTTEDYTDNSWHHVVAVYDGSNKYIYVDGVLKNSVAFSYSVFNSADWALGGYNGCNGGFNGKVDEVKIYSRPLSAAEVLDDYNLTKNSLVAYLPFNGNTIDESGNGHDGTINGNAALVPDRFNTSDRAFTFPNQSSNISLANSTNMNLENGFSLNAWIKYKNTYSVIIGKHVCGYVNGFILGIDYDGQLQLWLGNSGWSTVRTNETLMENRWYMVTATYDVNSGAAKIYLDGQLENSATISYTNFSSYPVSIGEVFQNNCSPANMSGAVDEVKIYNRALSDAEILDEYNITYNDLVLFLPFNGNANDESGSGNNGTVNGAALTQDRFGVNGQAFSFDGIDDHITIADNPNLFSDSLTISWWYNISEYDDAGAVIGWIEGGSRYQQFFNGTSFSYFNAYRSDPLSIINPIYILTNLNEWVNVVVTYKKNNQTSSTTSLFINGDLKQTDIHYMSMEYIPGHNFYIGRNHTPGVEFYGKLDDFRIFNRILNITEIVALYNDSTTYNPRLENGLVAYWPLNGNTNDSTFNNNDGINYNGVFSKDRYGDNNSSIFFNAVDSYVEGINPGNSLPVGNSPRTFSAWIRNNQYNQYGCNIFHYGTQQAAPTNFHFLITDVLGLGNGYGYGVVYGNTNLNDSTWHFVTGVYEGGTERTTKLYIDGKLDATGAITTEPNTVLTNNWRMGRFMEGSSNFNGNIDELKVYDIPLTNQQVWDIYKATTTAPNLIYPQDDSTLINPTMIGLVLDWDSTVTATGYRFLLANDSLFNSVIHDTIVNASSFNFYDWFSVNIDNLYWKVRTINDGGTGPWSETNRFNIMLTDVEDETQLPTEFALMQNYPNPFNPTTTIAYHLPNTSKVQLKVYDVLGNEIETLVNEEKSAGSYEVEFNASSLSSGMYLYKLQAGDLIAVKKLILLK
ncbi:MAG: T9SS type A sorting domain-containing protein [Ignavibacteriales bacterium]|nr:T9SS type A sorting domain-containing protein [Ignavibacteriales bacterium]